MSDKTQAAGQGGYTTVAAKEIVPACALNTLRQGVQGMHAVCIRTPMRGRQIRNTVLFALLSQDIDNPAK